MRSLDDVVRAGKVLYVGISDAPAWVVSRANTLAELKDWSPFAALQIQYNLADRSPERDLLPMAKALDLAVTPWGVLAGGCCRGSTRPRKTGRPERATAKMRFGPKRSLRNGAYGSRRRSFRSERTGRTASQVALAWVRRQPFG